ncbi:MAG TPA: cytochrome P450 [Candidatus Limnocylindrales bacterium]|nr:cytochrome P450 [Candidatus Limnocylindrales bacterium]
MTIGRSGSRLGADITLAELYAEPYAVLARLREHEPVAWVPVLDGWVVTRRDLCIEVMRDAQTFTVDDPRFSTARVVGPSMLSLDGEEHRRHRDPFAAALRRPEVMGRFADRVKAEAHGLVDGLAPGGHAEVRRDLAGPLAVRVVAAALDLLDVEPAVVLGWYDDIVAAVDRVSAGGEVGQRARDAVASLDRHVGETLARGAGLLSQATAVLAPSEVVSNAAVMMFGGIETSEGMTTSLFWHLLTTPGALDAVLADRSLVADAVEESLRLEPAAGRVDRYATVDVELGGAMISSGDLVIVSLTAANRDPATFPFPDSFELTRENARTHLAFAQGPHACVGLHLARLETQSAIEAALDGWPGLRLGKGATAPTGVVFRKPRSLPVRWD